MAKRRAHRPEGTPSVQRGRPPRSASRPATTGGPARADSRTRRERFEGASATWLRRMQALPTFLIPSVMGVALFLGLIVDARWPALLLFAIAAFLGWLTALSWPGISTTSRAIRAMVVVGLLVLGAFKLLGRV